MKEMLAEVWMPGKGVHGVLRITLQVHHQVPAGYITRRVGEQVGNVLGGFLDYDKNNNTGVNLDVRNPLKKDMRIKRQGVTGLQAESNEAATLKNILATFGEASGQLVNFQKSEVFFGRKASDQIKTEVAAVLYVNIALGTGKYLGLPSMVGRSKKSLFKFIEDQVWQKINSWSGRALSGAGREVLIKSVLQSIPTYMMSIFLIPSSLGDDIQKMMNSFWWGSKRGGNQGIHWLSWDKLSMAKDARVARVLKAKYFPIGDLLGAKIGSNPSYTWRSICSSRVLLKEGLRWNIGDGSHIHVWLDNWVRRLNGSKIQPVTFPISNNLLVSDLMSAEDKQWDEDVVRSLVGAEDVDSVLNTPLLDSATVDSLTWWPDSRGIFSVKSAYHLAVNNLIDTSYLRVNGDWSLVWNLEVPPVVKIFMWSVT
ncbi:unnamed protein product [Trifolium pratense]|uniref:Uncharacterized protein n=1 Tax=Trifolium pratense TaxID=57577 RepID=A0ACB0KTN1_TRIPR|nr:unnamed protein product [Trifolium pratense]